MQKDKTGWLMLGVVLIGANLRLPITMMPPLLGRLEASGALPPALAGLVTTLPLLAFALASAGLGRLGARWGQGQVLLGAAALLVVGNYLRVLPHPLALLGGTVLVGLAITGGNVLLPGLIKSAFPHRIALMTTLYTTAMGLVASLGTGTAGVLAQRLGAAGTIAVLSTVSVLALGVWLLAWPRDHGQAVTHQALPRVTRSRSAWLVAGFFGLQSLLYYSLLTWLPTIWQQSGFSAVAAGNLATLFQLAGLPMTVLTPSLAERRHGVATLVGLIAGGFGLGLLGVALMPAVFAWHAALALVMGAASGAAFSMCIVFFQQKTTAPAVTAALSGMAQAGGYLLAALGPVGFSALATAFGWTAVLWVCLALSVLLGGCGWAVMRSPQVDSPVD
ncbi:MFS transporter [Lacticaseibacillus absianus]|uniref:MFS transporter n=1 Tax=Lacticaseibacillus absianus TaxID=2729623 RepID=UPI0015CE454B|nr:MFS transporter [Lacticaseibacillus absianus]